MSRPRYESTVPVPWRLPASPKWWKGLPYEFGGERWWQQCGRKRAIFDKKEAAMLAQRLRNYFHKRGHNFGEYQCPWCEWWHLGHSKKAVSR